MRPLLNCPAKLRRLLRALENEYNAAELFSGALLLHIVMKFLKGA